MACELASPWHKTTRETPERQQSWGCVGELQANVTDSGLFGHGQIQSLRFAEAQGSDCRAGGELQGPGLPRRTGRGIQGRELKKLEFWTENKDRDWEL